MAYRRFHTERAGGMGASPPRSFRERPTGDDNLDATISRPTVRRGVVGDRGRRAEAGHVGCRRGNTFGDQVIAHGDRTLQRKLLILRRAARVVRVTLDVVA